MDDHSGTPVEKTLSSCTECRRRKARCDRVNPCNNCARFGRTCIYERVSRTPLTRKHLTNVERELARAKALLRQYEGNRSPSATLGAEVDGSPYGTHAPRDNDLSMTQTRPQQTNTSALVTFEDRRDQTSRHSAEGHVVENGILRGQSTTVNGHTARTNSPTFTLETSPASGEFDWDERVQKVSQAHFIDGMASLPERSSRGYMGVASGAALLRLADSTTDSGVDMENGHHEDHIQETPPIPNVIFSLSQLEPFVDAYFQTYHISYPIVHEATFRAQFMEVVPRPKGNAWQVLLHIIAALGSFAAAVTAPEVDVALFEAAKARMSIDMLETGNIVLVQALTLISNYVQKRNKPNSGYNYLGLAKRMAMGIGLHKEFPAWHSTPMRLEIRRRVYWCLYIFDVGATITFSRPLDLPQEGIEIQLPLNVADGDITINTKRFPSEVQETTLYTHVRCQSRFHLATEGIYAKLISAHFPSAEEMLQADDSHLVKWLQELPSYFREGANLAPKFRLCHSVLQWRWRNFRILMYRPYLMRKFMTKRRSTLPNSVWEDSAIQRCLEAAAESIQLITNYWQHGTQNVLACWYSLYFLFQATLIPVICLRNEPHSALAPGWRNQVFGALETISDMTRLNSAASRCYNVIMKLCGAYLAQDMSQWDSPTSESPLTQLNALNSFMWPMTDPQLSNGHDLAFFESVPFDFVNQFTM
ncbi:uncharacterized protein Z518_10790 [Rhinocladiella mackenziei CBS 650.93]|uniref:Zn(2)-C6 fungal-type domain-containing protein n=1 Tax=Rhinocladiella mackenziei CBS 650.93 TaxID=1442369 RepID=A0A0D2GNA7_9EURO|nr:uncharacterized protein Z518_10790 [Rhinocladiella mackenziei CBS 650.93]KIW99862.1 hypothetical protein Z518_10790 [Rhinocladiella mackenziei CBS 650.93]